MERVELYQDGKLFGARRQRRAASNSPITVKAILKDSASVDSAAVAKTVNKKIEDGDVKFAVTVGGNIFKAVVTEPATSAVKVTATMRKQVRDCEKNFKEVREIHRDLRKAILHALKGKKAN